MQKKNIIRIVIATILVLMVPLIAMQFTSEMNWSFFDFVVAGVLLLGTGLVYEFVSSRGGTTVYKAAVAVAVFSSLLLVWINLAVGIIGSEENPANLMYFAIPLVGLIGALYVWFDVRGMMRTMYVMAVAQALVPVIAFSIWRPDFSPGVIQVFFLSIFFSVLFVVSALLFRRAAITEGK